MKKFSLQFLSNRGPKRAEKSFSSIGRKIYLEIVAIYVLRDFEHIIFEAIIQTIIQTIQTSMQFSLGTRDERRLDKCFVNETQNEMGSFILSANVLKIKDIFHHIKQ